VVAVEDRAGSALRDLAAMEVAAEEYRSAERLLVTPGWLTQAVEVAVATARLVVLASSSSDTR
jgi:hypothetical protein